MIELSEISTWVGSRSVVCPLINQLDLKGEEVAARKGKITPDLREDRGRDEAASLERKDCIFVWFSLRKWLNGIM